MAFLRENKHNSFTADELLAHLDGVGKSTLYRLLSHLMREGELREGMRGRCKTYSFRSHECIAHLHLYCEECGKYAHLSEEATNEIIGIISRDMGFDASALDWEIRGRCRECAK